MSKHAGNTTKQTPYSILKCLPGICQANSFSQMPALQSFTREFWLSTNQSAPRGERFTVLPGKVYFQVFTRAPSLRYTTRHQRTQGQCTRQYPGPATTTHTAERPRRPRSVYTYSARHALATFRLSSSQRNAHSGSFIPGDCGPRSPRRARASEDRVPCDRRRSTQQLAKPQDEASERRPRARVHQRYAVFHAPSSGNAFKPYSFLPDTVPSRNTALRSRANAFAPTKRSRRIDDHPVASTDLVSHPFASDTASVSTGKNTVDSSVHATAFDAPFDDAPAPVAPATPVNTPAAPRETKVYDDVDCIIEVRFRPRYPPFAPRGVRSDPNFGPVRFKNVD